MEKAVIGREVIRKRREKRTEKKVGEKRCSLKRKEKKSPTDLRQEKG